MRHPKKVSARPTRHPIVLAVAAASVLALQACGSDDDGASGAPAVPATVAVAGVVADGPLSGATACYDLNDNAACDSGEPSAVSDADGKFGFEILADDAGKHGMVVNVPATAIDKDTGAAVGTAFTLKSPPTGTAGAQSVFVSPLTTLVVDVAASQGLSTQDAESAVKAQLGMNNSPLANFVGTDAQAATLATTVNTVIIEVTKLAAAGGASTGATAALVGSVSTGDLSTLAELVKNATATTPAGVASEVVATVLAERNLDSSTVAKQAELALQIATSVVPAAAPGPFFSVRRFTYSDANNHQLQAFVGDSTPGADGTYFASEVRVNLAGGVAQPFNRNQAYWSKTSQAWEVCPQAWQLIRVTPAKPATATSPALPQVSTFCGGSVSRTISSEVDLKDRKMADVVAEMRASPLRDAPGFDTDETGLPKHWGPDPALLGSATFPEGARLGLREQVNEVGDTERYSLTDKPRVIPAGGSGTYRHAATFGDLKRMSGNLVTGTATVSNLNSVFLDDLPFEQTDPALTKVKRYRVAFDPGSDAVRFFACDVLASNNTSQNCVALGDGGSSIAVQADSRVLRFTAGYPQALTLALKRQRLFVERSGAVFGGNRDLERKIFQHRPNTVAWNALRTAIGMAEPAAPVAPPGPGPFETLRRFTFTDADNFFARILTGDDSIVDGNGDYTVTDQRIVVSGGIEQPGALNTLFWTGSEWTDCGIVNGKLTFPANARPPFRSLFCQTYDEERYNRVIVTLNGRRISDVVQDIRWYSSRDGSFDHANWGPSPNQAGAAVFPEGATMTIQGGLRKATPFAVGTAAGDQVRVPPADSSVPFETWPFATSLVEFIAKYPGDLNGGPLNGATAFYVFGYDLPAPPAAAYTTRVEYRVAFNAAGNVARFYRNNRSASNGFTTNYVKVLDTSYSLQTLGGTTLLSFAAMPEGFEDEFAFQRMFAQRNGAVWYAFKDTVSGKPLYSIRLNKSATEALATALGIN